MLPPLKPLPAVTRGRELQAAPLVSPRTAPLAGALHLQWAGRALLLLWLAGAAGFLPLLGTTDLTANDAAVTAAVLAAITCGLMAWNLDRLPAASLDVLLAATSTATAVLAGTLPHSEVLVICALSVVPFAFALLPPRRALAQAFFLVLVHGLSLLLLLRRPDGTTDVAVQTAHWGLLVLTVTALALVMRRLADYLYRRSLVAEAVADLGRRALSVAEPDDLLAEALHVAVRVIGSDYGTALRRLPDGRVRVAAEVGPFPLPAGTDLPLADDRSYALHVIRSGQPFTSSDLSDDPRVTPPAPLLNRGLRSSLAVPVMGSSGTIGVLALHAKRKRRFSTEEVSAAMALAHVVATAWQQVTHRQDQARLAMYADRERIALDLHDTIIQRIFAAGLALQTLRRHLPTGRPTERLDHIGDDLDSAITDIRATIFALKHDPAHPPSVSSEIFDTTSAAAAPLGFEPAVILRGPVDSEPVREVAGDLLPVLAEALSNVARHADAHSVTVEVSARPGDVTLRVSDDGRGLGESPRRSGLGNMTIRAERLAGRCEVDSDANRGTTVTWSVPLQHEAGDLHAAAG